MVFFTPCTWFFSLPTCLVIWPTLFSLLIVLKTKNPSSNKHATSMGWTYFSSILSLTYFCPCFIVPSLHTFLSCHASLHTSLFNLPSLHAYLFCHVSLHTCDFCLASFHTYFSYLVSSHTCLSCPTPIHTCLPCPTSLHASLFCFILYFWPNFCFITYLLVLPYFIFLA